MKRQSGVLLPVSALPGPFGCGTFGAPAYDWIDRLHKGGFSCWQVLPFGIPDTHNSPYMPYSSFAGNPNFIDPSALYLQGLVTKEELEDQRVNDPYLCQFDTLRSKRYTFFKRAAQRLSDHRPVEKFCDKNPHIAAACRFLALKSANHDAPWREWTITEPLIEDLQTWQFIQYEFHRQWNLVHDYAAQKGIFIIGDLPFYVAYDSSDVWATPEQFQLDPKRNPSCVSGVPPDYFSEDGQLWGNPLYDWDHMKKDGFSWWKDRLSYMLSLFDGVRIDHFRAISAYWSVPATAQTAKEGCWKPGPGKELIDAFAPLATDKLILAENLGMIDQDTQDLLAYSGYPGMAVFQFGFDGDPANVHLPHNYTENLVAYTGTHDNNTLLGFLWELDDATRKTVLEYVGSPIDGCPAIRSALLMSRAGMVIFPVQDLLAYGADTRINTPGRAVGNWAYRITEEQLDRIDWPLFDRLNRIYARK